MMSLDDVEARIDELEAKVKELEDESPLERRINSAAGYLMGMALAMILSFSHNSSILWCILHGVLSWLYVIYFAFAH